jgi:peroxiredoxin
VYRRTFVIAAALAIYAGEAACCAEGKPPIGGRITDFTAQDASGRTFTLSQVDRSKVVVLAFLGVDCPLVKRFTPRIVELAGQFQRRGVIFVAIDANRQDSITEIAAYARRYKIGFPFLKDLRQTIADRVGATRTPEVVILDRERRISYRGRIDDQFGFKPGNRAATYHKTASNRNDLQIALDELLAGKAVSIPETPVDGCLIGHDRAPAAHPLGTYARDVAPILNRHCVGCHRPKQIAPFSLNSYECSVGWADMIAEVTQLNRMPPWHADPNYGVFENDARLSDDEKRVLVQWAEDGAPQGNPTDLPPPPRVTDGWMIPEPDEVIYMPQPFDVPATGIVPYQNFVIDPGWKKDRWISAIEGKAGNRSVVHHILFYIIPPGERAPQLLRADDTFLGTYAPGNLPEVLAPGWARPVPAGSKFLFNIHYTPNGSPQLDRSCIGIKFADPRSVVREVTMSAAFNKDFAIPPGAANHAVQAQYKFSRDSLLLGLSPHMHYRGNEFQFEALYPDGAREMLLSVPRYDFGWQTLYRLKEPKRMPAGTVIHCLAHYDNSVDNLNNPDPKAEVRWGEQTSEEMMIGFLEIAPASEGLVHRTTWWKPLLAQFGMVAHFRVEWLAAVALTAVNVLLFCVLVARAIRSRKRSAELEPRSILPSPPEDLSRREI